MIEPKRERRRRERIRKLRWVVQRYGKLEILAIVVGAIAGVAAVSLDTAIEVFRGILNQLEGSFTLGFLDLGLIIAPAIGGLISGLIVWKIAPEVKGHGIPSVLEAFLFREGVIRPRVPLARITSSGALIGLGGSAGREGPIGQVGAGVGSFLAVRAGLPARSRRILLISGLSAGIAAAFDAPLGGVLFGIEVLTGAVQPVELIPAFLASISAVTVSWNLRGARPVISIPEITLPTFPEILLLLLLGAILGLVSKLWVDVLYGFEERFTKLRLPEPLKPALGGLGTGIIAFWTLGWGIMGPGFDGLNRILLGQGMIEFLILLAVLKMVATSLSVGSGGSGGIFTPTLFVGAAIGGAYGQILYLIDPHLFPRPELFAIAGMAAHFTAAARAPLTSVVLVMELGRSYALIPSLIAACSISYLLSIMIMETTMYTRELEERGERVRHYGLETLELVRVGEIMSENVVTVGPEQSLREVHELILHTHHTGFPVVDEEGRLVGMITLEDLSRVNRRQWSKVKVGDIMSRKVLVASPDETCQEASEKMLRHGIGRLPVVRDRRLVGIVTRTDLLKGYARAISKTDVDEAASV